MAQNVYALLVGIDVYPRPEYNLRGCVNDISAFEEIMATMVPANVLKVQKLLNDRATRAAVIAGFEHHLSHAGPGDTALFYYAGHGSQERAPEEFWKIEPDRLNE